MACEWDSEKGLVSVKADGSVTVLAFAEGSRSITGRITFTADEWRTVTGLKAPGKKPAPVTGGFIDRSGKGTRGGLTGDDGE
ncbi:MAG TPA: hypothetical protein VFH61_05685 [Thermoleophilia bacterium]|nr:hypothetical protein [Thermoleophilia bacterium]